MLAEPMHVGVDLVLCGEQLVLFQVINYLLLSMST